MLVHDNITWQPLRQYWITGWKSNLHNYKQIITGVFYSPLTYIRTIGEGWSKPIVVSLTIDKKFVDTFICDNQRKKTCDNIFLWLQNKSVSSKVGGQGRQWYGVKTVGGIQFSTDHAIMVAVSTSTSWTICQFQEIRWPDYIWWGVPCSHARKCCSLCRNNCHKYL